MEWGTWVSGGGGGQTRPRLAPSLRGGVGGNTSPRAAATPSGARGRGRAEAPSARSPQPHRPPAAAATGTGTQLGRHHGAGGGGLAEMLPEPREGGPYHCTTGGARPTGQGRAPATLGGRRRPAASGPDRTTRGRGAAAGARPGGLAACDRGPLCRREHRPWTAALPTHLRHTHTHTPPPGSRAPSRWHRPQRGQGRARGEKRAATGTKRPR